MSNNKISDKELSNCFYMKPDEIIDFFKSKGLKTSFDWHEVYEDAHARAFTIAKMTETDLLSDTKKLLEEALEEGTAYSNFKKNATKLFQEKGWIGKKEVKDPNTGEIKTVELGTPRRIKLIYDCNMNSSYSVGRYKEQLEEIDVAPIWQYFTLNDGKERPAHKALHGKCYRADDLIWDKIYPPNDFGCRCYVRNMSEATAKREGLNVEKTQPKQFKTIKTTVGTGENTREVVQTEFTFENAGNVCKMRPGKGWGTNLGVKALGIDIQAWNKVENLPEKLKYSFISKMAENPHNKEVFKLAIAKVIKNGFKTNKKIEKTINWIQPDIYRELIKNKLEPKTPIVALQEKQVPHIIGSRQKLSEKEIYQIYDIIENPDAVYIDYTMANDETYGLVYTKNIPNTEDCIKVCTKLSKKSKITGDPVNYLSTAGKVKQHNMEDTKLYKRIK